MLRVHAERMTREGRLVGETVRGFDTERGLFFTPQAFEIDAISRLDHEGVRAHLAYCALCSRPSCLRHRLHQLYRIWPDVFNP